MDPQPRGVRWFPSPSPRYISKSMVFCFNVPPTSDFEYRLSDCGKTRIKDRPGQTDDIIEAPISWG